MVVGRINRVFRKELMSEVLFRVAWWGSTGRPFSVFISYLCNVFSWYTVKYPTNDLIYQYTYESLGECVYKENSSHGWDIHGVLRENIA